MRMLRRRMACAALAGTLGGVPVAFADEREELQGLRDTTLRLIQLLVEQGVLNKERADALIKQAQQPRAPSATPPGAATKPAAPTVRVPYIPESVKAEIRDQVKEDVVRQAKAERWGDVNAIPEWTQHIKLYGDVRLRYQGDRFRNDDPELTSFLQQSGTDITNTTENRDRLRVRARLGIEATVADWVRAGARLATGTATNPVSTNQTLGTTSRPYSTFFDLAYIQLDPAPWFSASGGRIPNPWFGTDLLWASDLTFEGVQTTFKPQLSKSTSFFLTTGAFPIQEIERSATNRAKSKWLLGIQAGAQWKSTAGHGFKVGAAIYDYRNVEGIPNEQGFSDRNATAPQFRQKGNTVFNIDGDGDPNTDLFALASKFREVNVTAAWDLELAGGVHLIAVGDYVKNIGFDESEIATRTQGRVANLQPKTKGYLARVAFGMPGLEKRGAWQASLGYKHLERDAVLDAFTDGDFRLGGTDAKGYVFAASYVFAKQSWLTFRYLSANPISGPPLRIDVMQLDLNARF
ncbi:MAG: putative porin [Burkholderiales bacterium]